MQLHPDLLSRITVNPEVMLGKPVIRGMRISAEQLLRALAGGVPVQALLDDYPELRQEDLQAVFLYAATLVSEERVLPVKLSV
ncbi:MAG: DUF433 domain-containing protein [Gammaproteobacteria bacterium]|nr:DUF433 domain-containing protein [Gammaproteobacteria bacterium]